ncbi:hypothetical protein ACVIOG_003799 [Rhizobium leguminosarum]
MMDQRVDLPPRQQITDLKQAAEHIRTARRILVMGCSGGGKSTLSLKIAKRFGLSYISLDRDVFWLPGWVVRDSVEQRNIIASRILEERWIMDGTNPSSLDIRLPRSDFVIWVRSRGFSVSGAQSAGGRNGSAALGPKWRGAVSRRSIGNSSASSGPSRRNLRRASSPASPHMALTCRFFS